ncbi:MAG: TonB-dependent hemoglobin/transferrin/lactoferrin receptor family protein [Acidobacteriaceae bacterium]|nr:TonB-dependent hemoglobin/transferrin/lactoferrin receptor family protein [Acidobacteriaceae bacterium]
MRRLFHAVVLFLFFCALLLVCLPARAQVDRGTIVGTVTDPSGARISDAAITLTNRDTGEPIHLTTNSEGDYNAKLVKIGNYSVSATKQGFEKTIQQSVDVAVNQSVRVDLVLKLGSTSETVEVTGAAPLLQTESSSLGTIETEKRISDLPLNGRNFIQLAYLGPGANAGQTGSNVSGGVFENERADEAVSVNGLRVSNNNFLLNGVDNNEFGLGGVIVLPPPDAIQEFKTEENSMSAEFGRGGAAVNVVLKSGTNRLHGGVYEFIRNDKLDAVNYFNQGQQPFKRNQFGGFLGGPIQKNRTFLFGDYQGSRLRASNPFLSTVPTVAERGGNFSDRLTGQTFSPCPTPRPADTFDTGTIFNPFSTNTNYTCADGSVVSLRTPVSSNNVIPSNLINQVGSNIANFYPKPNLGGLTNNYLANQNQVNDQDSFDVRVDHRFSDQDQLFGSYSFGDVRSQRPGPLGPLWGGSDCCPSVSNSRAQHLGTGYTHVFSERLLNDLHGGYFRYAVNALPFNFGKNLGAQLGIPNVNRPAYPNSSGLTNIDVAGFTSLGDSQYLPEHVFENIFQVADTLTLVKGRHSLKFGVDFRRQQRNFFQLSNPRGYFNFDGGYTNDLTTANGGNGLADLLFGVPISNEQDFLAGLYPTRYWDLAEFVQDDFRVTHNFTINMGLRYELTSPANGQVGNFDLNRAIVVTSYGANAVSHAGVRFDKKDWGPRLGFAWSVGKNTVVRSAFGMFYSAEANIFDDLGLNPPQLTFYAANFNAGANPLPSQLISNGFPSTLPPGSATNISGPVKTTGPIRLVPRILEWNMSVQHQFAQNWLAQIGYVGTRSYDLWNHEASDLNQAPQILDTNFCGPDLSNCTQPNFGRRYFAQQPNMTQVLPLDYPQFQSFYNAFQASLNKRFSQGFNMLVSYTFAKNLGNADGNVGGYVQNSYFPNLEHGPVAPDLRQRFSVSYLYELPVGRGRRFFADANGITDAVLGGWQVAGITAAQTGEAVNAIMSNDLSNTGSFSYRPNQIANPYDFSFDIPGQASLGCSNPGHQALDCWFNQAAFVAPPLAPGQQSAHSFGDAKIGDLRGPNMVDFDLVLQKSFKVRESQQLEFRFELFNLFNHPNFGLPGGGSLVAVDVQGGGAITNTASDNRQIELALKYMF